MWYLLLPFLTKLYRYARFTWVLLILSSILLCFWLWLHLQLAQAAFVWKMSQERPQEPVTASAEQLLQQRRSIILSCGKKAGVRLQYAAKTKRLFLAGSLERVTYALWLLDRAGVRLSAIKLCNEGTRITVRGTCQ
jgi:hypothetical protein